MSFRECQTKLSTGKLTYFSSGDGAPFIFLHAAGGVRLTQALQELSSDSHVYSPVIPGFDGTPLHDGVDSMTTLAALCADFVQHIVRSPVHVGGQGFGGWAAAWLAVLYPELVQSLVLESPNGFCPKDAPPPSTDPAVMRKQMYAHPELLPPETKARETIIRNSKIQHHYDHDIRRDEELISKLNSVRCETLLLLGVLDGRNPRATVDLVHSRIPKSRLLVFDDCAHNVEVDQCERFVRVVSGFVNRGDTFFSDLGSDLDGISVVESKQEDLH